MREHGYSMNPFSWHNFQSASVQVQAVCDAHLRFLDIDAGWPGSVHDARVFRQCDLYTHLDAGNLPEDQHLLGDSAYGLTMYMITPYRNNGHLTEVQKAFNRRHSSTRSAIERAFGLLKCKFRRLNDKLDMTCLEMIPTVILSATILHNFILSKEKINFHELDAFMQIGHARDPEDHHDMDRARAQRKRDELAARIGNV